MPALELGNDTYREFFNIKSWQDLCKTEWQREILQILADSIPNYVKEEIQGMVSRKEVRVSARKTDSSGIPLLAANLKQIIQKFQNCHEDKKKFTRSFHGFRLKRLESVEKLRKIGDKINNDRFNVNISKNTGAVASFMGGGLLIGGAVATFLSGGAAAPLVGAGLVLCGGGGATTFGASAAELALLRADIRHAKAVIEEDKANFQTFSQWLQQSLEMQETLRQVMDIDLLQRTVQDFGSVLRMTFARNGNLEPLRQRVQSFVNVFMRNVGGMQSMGYWINAVSLVVGFVFALISIQSRNRFAFDAGFCVLRVGLSVARFVDVGVDAVTTGLSLVRGGGAAVATGVGRLAAHTAMAAVGMALDVATVVLTSIDIHKGSKSEDAAKIKEVADKLEEELSLLAKIYEELRD